MNLSVLQKLTYGLYVVGAFKDGKAVGCVINTCFQVTSERPLLAISLNKSNYTLDAIREFKRFSLSIVAEDTNPEIIGRFGFLCSRDVDKYENFGYEVAAGAPYVKGQFAGRLFLQAEQFVDCETHVLVIARLTDTIPGSGTPMTYEYYHRVVKGKAPKSAPTYCCGDTAGSDEKPAEKPSAATKRRYECDVCGYVVEVDGELPDDYVCPLCGVDRSHFRELK